MSRELIEMGLIGAGGHASDVTAALERRAFVESTPLSVHLFADGEFDQRRFVGRPAQYRGGIEQIRDFRLGAWILAVGYPKSRIALRARVNHLDLHWGKAIHPGSMTDFGVEIEEGTVVFGGATLSPFVALSKHVVVGQNASVGHDSVIGEFSSIMPHACVSGNCVVGRGVLVGAGAVILEGLEIGDGAVVGAGTVVLNDVPAGAKVVGVPGKPR